jgi:Type IV secretion-system coupling protein DNA-binding domain
MDRWVKGPFGPVLNLTRPHARSATKTIDLGHYDPDGEYYGDGGEPGGLFFDDATAKDLRKVKPESLRFVIPADEFKGHCVLVGQSGSGKTQTLLRLIEQVSAQLDWQIIVVDAKADSELERDIKLIAAKANKKYGAFPARPYDLWRGSPSNVATRLMELVAIDPNHFAEAHALFAKAVSGGAGSATSWEIFKHNLGTVTPRTDVSASVRRDLSTQISGVFEGALGELLRGELRKNGDLQSKLPINVAELDICYLGVDALSLPFAASNLAACLLREVADFVVNRRARESRKILLIFDEFSAVPTRVATDLVERIRSFGVQVILGVQSFTGLGPDAERLLEASNWLMMHRSANPEPFLTVVGNYTAGMGMKSMIDGLELRRLEDGRIYVALHGRVAKVAVSRWGS